MDFVVQEKIPDNYVRRPVLLGVTPLVLQLCEIDICNVRTSYGAIEKEISAFISRSNDDERYKNIHNMNPEDLKQIPVQICNPIAIIQSQTVASVDTKKANGLIILTELVEINKKTKQPMPTIAAIHLSYNKKHKEMELSIRSTYGKSNEFIVDNLSSNLLMYLNREKCRKLLQNHFTPSVIRNLYSDNNRQKRLQIIREMCETEIHKDRSSLNTGVTAMEARCYIKENSHLYETNHNAKQSGLQDKKRTVPTPTGYKTEEDLRQFRLAVCKQALTQIEQTDIQQWQCLYNHAKETLTTEQKQHLSVAERYLHKSLNDSNATEQYQAFCITNFYRSTINEILDGTINIPNPYALDKSITQKPTVKQDKGIDLA